MTESHSSEIIRPVGRDDEHFGGKRAAELVYDMAGVTPQDIDVAQFYDSPANDSVCRARQEAALRCAPYRVCFGGASPPKIPPSTFRLGGGAWRKGGRH